KGNLVENNVSEVDLYTVSDLPSPVRATLAWRVYHIDGQVLLSGEMPVRMNYGEAIKRRTLDLAKVIKQHGVRRIYLRIQLLAETGESSDDTVFLTAPRFMDLPRATARTRIRRIHKSEFAL